VALVLAWGSLFGESKTTSAAMPIVMSSIPGAPVPSGVSGTTYAVDFANPSPPPAALTGSTSTVNGLGPFANSPSPPYPPTWATVFYWTEPNCTPGKSVAVAVYHVFLADQTIFLTNGVAFGTLPADPAILIDPNTQTPYVGAAAIQSAGVLTLRGYPQYNPALVQYLACGNADGSTVSFPRKIANDWTLVPPSVSIDMVKDAGNTWCNPVDPIGSVPVPVGGTDYYVAICLSGVPPVAVPPEAGGSPSALQFTMTYNPQLNECVIPNFEGETCDPLDPGCLDSNPDANAAHTGGTIFNGTGLGTKWTCNISDVKPSCNNTTGEAFIQCNMTSGTGTLTLPVGLLVSWPLAVVKMHAKSIGIDNLAMVNTEVDDAGLLAEVKCFGTPCLAGAVFGAVDNKVEPPPATATPTPVPATATFTPAPTNTPVPGVRMEKDANPLLAGIQDSANLWLMKSCVAPKEGKGCLEIDLWISGIFDTDSPNDSDLLPEGLGAWEDQKRFDHKFISLTPVPDNTWLESGGRVANCTMMVLTEDWILEGCVTKDTVAPPATGHLGPNGPASPDGLIERIYVQPKWQDLIYRSDFRPTKDNGIITDIVDDNCEVTDTLGEQIPGTLPGQLTTVCSDVHITIRMLQGDLDLDCDVDVLDDQAIAFGYGSRLGLLLYDRWFDLEPKWSDDDIDIKDLQFVFGRNWSTCQAPIPNDQANPAPVPIDP